MACLTQARLDVGPGCLNNLKQRNINRGHNFSNNHGIQSVIFILKIYMYFAFNYFETLVPGMEGEGEGEGEESQLIK